MTWHRVLCNLGCYWLGKYGQQQQLIAWDIFTCDLGPTPNPPEEIQQERCSCVSIPYHWEFTK